MSEMKLKQGNSDLVWLQIDGELMPTPSEFTPVYADFDSDSSTRNEIGYLTRQVIRTGQVSPKFKWTINTKQLSYLLKAISNEHLSVTYFDPKEMALKTFDGYAQATRQPKLVLQKDTYGACLWSFECSFIEY